MRSASPPDHEARRVRHRGRRPSGACRAHAAREQVLAEPRRPRLGALRRRHQPPREGVERDDRGEQQRAREPGFERGEERRRVAAETEAGDAERGRALRAQPADEAAQIPDRLRERGARLGRMAVEEALARAPTRRARPVQRQRRTAPRRGRARLRAGARPRRARRARRDPGDSRADRSASGRGCARLRHKWTCAVRFARRAR